MDKLSQTDECVTISRWKISRMLFVDNLVLLGLSELGLQHALNGFAVSSHRISGMKISTSETAIQHFSRNPVQFSLQVDRVSLKKTNILGSHSRVVEGKTKNWMFDQTKQVL